MATIIQSQRQWDTIALLVTMSLSAHASLDWLSVTYDSLRSIYVIIYVGLYTLATATIY